ncbi:hypothetical protein J3454_00685 [Erythrobacter sp. NFXS35]|uniref:hypothetical protein n=1 Tax=Erythrobacter sp. NFXS35 TaxID=2818436 RepID=UPI0032DE8AF0
MTFSPTRSLVFFVIGLPLGFILCALGFVTMAQPITAPAIAPWALSMAALIGLGAGVWRPAE